jgi:hypothetical protein
VRKEEVGVRSGEMASYMEENIINAVKSLLWGRVTELLGEMEDRIPPLETSGRETGPYAVTPVLRLAGCERTEKERVVKQDAYTLTITFAVPESPNGERNAYAYGQAVDLALAGDRTLGGVADRAVLAGKKYVAPKRLYSGEGWGVVLILRLSVESLGVR